MHKPVHNGVDVLACKMVYILAFHIVISSTIISLLLFLFFNVEKDGPAVDRDS